MGTTMVEERLFSFPKLKFLTDNIFNTSVRDKKLVAFSIFYSTKDDSYPFFAYFSDDDSLLAP